MSMFSVIAMTTNRLPMRSAGMPWPALIAMALTTFLVVSGEMMPTAVLPLLASDLEVTTARAGLLVSAWAGTVVLASFPLTRLTARFERPTVIAGALTIFAIATLVTALAPTYAVAMGSRVVAAAATGLLWSTINAHAASIVPEHRIARATAIVLAGGMMGTVGGLPVGNALAAAVGWRLPFVALAALGLVGAGAALVLLRRVPVVDHATDAGHPSTTSRPLWPVLALGAVGGLLLLAHFMPFTFVAEILAPSDVSTPLLLVLFGLIGTVGVALVGATSDRFPTIVPVVLAGALAVSLATVLGIGRSAGLDLVIVLAWGLAAGAAGPAVQASLMHAAGARHRRTAGTLMPVAMNVGIALGAAAGSSVVDRWSIAPLPTAALLPALLAGAGFLVIAAQVNSPRPRPEVAAAPALR